MKIKMSEVWKGIIILGLSLLVSSITKDLDLLPGISKTPFVLLFIAILLLSIGIVNITLCLVGKFIKWKNTPDRKNIRLSTCPFGENEIHIELHNREFRRPQVRINKIEVGLSGSANWLGVSHLNSLIDRHKSKDFRFLELNPIGNYFVVVYPGRSDLERFEFGNYIFDIVVTYGYADPREGLLKRYKVSVEYSEKGKIKISKIQNNDDI